MSKDETTTAFKIAGGWFLGHGSNLAVLFGIIWFLLKPGFETYAETLIAETVEERFTKIEKSVDDLGVEQEKLTRSVNGLTVELKNKAVADEARMKQIEKLIKLLEQ